MFKREHEIRTEAIQIALSTGSYAVCPYGFQYKFIWDWQQDCFIELNKNVDVPQLEIKSIDFNNYHKDIGDFVCHKSNDSEITDTITLHFLNDFIYGFSTENGTEFVHKKWKDIDFEKCGF